MMAFIMWSNPGTKRNIKERTEEQNTGEWVGDEQY